MGDNPIKIADPLGDEWRDASDQRIANRISKLLERRELQLQKQEQKLQARIDKAGASGNTSKVEKLTAQKSNIGTSRQNVATARTEIAAMGADKNMTFAFNKLGSNQSVGFISGDKDGTVVINFVDGALGNTVHELKHAAQAQQGLIKVNPGTDIVNFTGILPINSEIQAYQRQYAVAPNTLPPSDAGTPGTLNRVTGEYVKGINYQDATGNKIYPYSDKIYNIK